MDQGLTIEQLHLVFRIEILRCDCSRLDEVIGVIIIVHILIDTACLLVLYSFLTLVHVPATLFLGPLIAAHVVHRPPPQLRVLTRRFHRPETRTIFHAASARRAETA